MKCNYVKYVLRNMYNNMYMYIYVYLLRSMILSK